MARRKGDDEEPREAPGRVTGIGGVFFRARDHLALAGWYRDILGLPVTDAATAKMGTTVWAAFDHDTGYFGPNRPDHMINYRVDDLEAVLAKLRAVGASVAPQIDEDEYGRFAWAVDPEGHRFELWEPAPGA